MALNEASITFNLDTKKYVIEDSTNYPGQGIDPNDVDITFLIIAPNGLVLYQNNDYDSPDIAPNGTFDTVTLGQDVDGNVLTGNHIIRMRSRYNNGGDLEYSQKQYTLNYNFTAPTVNQSIDIDYYSPLLKSTDTTNYLVNGVSPNEPIVRVNKIIYPPVLNLADITSSAAIVQTAIFYTIDGGYQYTFTLTAPLTYVYNTGDALTSYSVFVTVSGNEFRTIESPQDICDIYCALKAAQARFEAAKCTNATNLSRLTAQFVTMVALAQMIMQAFRCGKVNDIAGYKAQLLALGGATEDCCCGEDGEPALVTGIGGTGAVATVVEAGTGVVVSFDGDYTYTVSIDPAVLSGLGVVYTVDSTDGSIGITTTVAANGDVTYDLAVANQLQMLDVQVDIDFSAVALPVMAGSGQWVNKQYGVWFPVSVGGATPFIKIDPAIVDFADYLVSPVVFECANSSLIGQTFFASVERMTFNQTPFPLINVFNDVKAEIASMDYAAGTFRVRLVRNDGTPHTGASIVAGTASSTLGLRMNFKITR